MLRRSILPRFTVSSDRYSADRQSADRQSADRGRARCHSTDARSPDRRPNATCVPEKERSTCATLHIFIAFSPVPALRLLYKA